MKKIALKQHTGLVLAFLMLFVLVGCGTQIPSGHRGVKYLKFGDGTEMGTVYDEGFNWHLPWNKIYVYKIQLSERKEDLSILSSDGASISMEVSIWFRPIDSKLDSLQKTIGPGYYNSIVATAIRGVGRSVVGQYKPEEIYSSKREIIASEILKDMQTLMTNKFVSVENIIIRNVGLPPRITDAINAKLAADQEQQKMQFTILKETQEAERKRIEARGIADFQKIVSSGITPTLLKWKGIEATEKLANSPNAKIVIIGNSEDGLPIILGGGK
ncbi:MAG: prohibitin family protein [candidate division Zixibacteria bacterium]|nr:prohibitin family protein [candidate division Zixibacteria bacterium]